jgi:hypothetical protein
MAGEVAAAPQPALSPEARGEYGADLGLLKTHYSPPQQRHESNYFIDLWSDQDLRMFALACGMTNNHALFINSHGTGLATAHGIEYVLYPHASLLQPKEKICYYSAADMARLLGADANRIHNLVLASCNTSGAFDARALRKYFVNATNVIHMAAGEPGYQSMFRQVFTSHSSKIKPMYESCVKNKSGELEYILGDCPSPKATRLSPYMAELFRPGEMAAFRTQIAGRELLAPAQASLFNFASLTPTPNPAISARQGRR